MPWSTTSRYWTDCRDLGSCHRSTRGRSHPRYPDVVYPLDYGHLTDTTSADGAEVDVFVGRAGGRGVVGVLLTADLDKRDVEIKILLDCGGR